LMRYLLGLKKEKEGQSCFFFFVREKGGQN
jgi:hypothetical protein